MQAQKKNVALIEAAAGAADANYQKSILARYAEIHNIEIDKIYGERAPLAGATGETDHKDVLNDIKDGGVGLLLVLTDVRHAVAEEVIEACRKEGVTVKFIDVQQQRGLAQPV